MPLCSLSPFEKFKMVLSRISFSRSNIFKPKIRYWQPWVETPPTVLSSVVFHSFSRQPICQASPGRDSGHFFGHQRHHPRLHHEVSNRVCASSLDFHCLSYHENHLGDPINFINVISFTRFLVGRGLLPKLHGLFGATQLQRQCPLHFCPWRHHAVHCTTQQRQKPADRVNNWMAH